MLILVPQQNQASVNSLENLTEKMSEGNSQLLDRREVEAAFYNLLAYGDEARIAENMPEQLGASATIISQYLSPGNERIGPIYRALCMIVAMLKFDQEKGRAALKLFMHFAGRYVVGWGTDSSATLRKYLVTAWENFIAGELEQRPLERQVKALEDVVMQGQRLLTAKRKELVRNKAKVNTLAKFGGLKAVGK